MKFTNDKITYFTSCIILIAIYLRCIPCILSNLTFFNICFINTKMWIWPKIHIWKYLVRLNYYSEDFAGWPKFYVLNIRINRREINRLFPIVEHAPAGSIPIFEVHRPKEFHDFYQRVHIGRLRKNEVFGGKQKSVKPSGRQYFRAEGRRSFCSKVSPLINN